jgi:two-component system response regulator DesR
VLDCLAKGFSLREITEKLRISYGTVRNYISSMLKTTGCQDRHQLILLAKECGF